MKTWWVVYTGKRTEERKLVVGVDQVALLACLIAWWLGEVSWQWLNWSIGSFLHIPEIVRRVFVSMK
jgi:hypothetical protein